MDQTGNECSQHNVCYGTHCNLVWLFKHGQRNCGRVAHLQSRTDGGAFNAVVSCKQGNGAFRNCGSAVRAVARDRWVVVQSRGAVGMALRSAFFSAIAGGAIGLLLSRSGSHHRNGGRYCAGAALTDGRARRKPCATFGPSKTYRAVGFGDANAVGL